MQHVKNKAQKGVREEQISAYRDRRENIILRGVKTVFGLIYIYLYRTLKDGVSGGVLATLHHHASFVEKLASLAKAH